MHWCTSEKKALRRKTKKNPLLQCFSLFDFLRYNFFLGTHVLFAKVGFWRRVLGTGNWGTGSIFNQANPSSTEWFASFLREGRSAKKSTQTQEKMAYTTIQMKLVHVCCTSSNPSCLEIARFLSKKNRFATPLMMTLSLVRCQISLIGKTCNSQAWRNLWLI